RRRGRLGGALLRRGNADARVVQEMKRESPSPTSLTLSLSKGEPKRPAEARASTGSARAVHGATIFAILLSILSFTRAEERPGDRFVYAVIRHEGTWDPYGDLWPE